MAAHSIRDDEEPLVSGLVDLVVERVLVVFAFASDVSDAEGGDRRGHGSYAPLTARWARTSSSARRASAAEGSHRMASANAFSAFISSPA